MQVGILFLWILSVGSVFFVWAALEWALASGGKTPSRRRITGCELARLVLDRNHLNQVPVRLTSAAGRFHVDFEVDRVILSEKVFYGASLADSAISLHEACHPPAGGRWFLPASVRSGGRRIAAGILLLSWFLAGLGFFFPSRQGWAVWGELFFVLMTFRALVLVGEESEVTDRALAELVTLEGFGIDERVRLKHILDLLRWSPLAEMVSLPFSLFRRNRKGVPVRVS